MQPILGPQISDPWRTKSFRDTHSLHSRRNVFQTPRTQSRVPKVYLSLLGLQPLYPLTKCLIDQPSARALAVPPYPESVPDCLWANRLQCQSSPRIDRSLCRGTHSPPCFESEKVLRVRVYHSRRCSTHSQSRGLYIYICYTSRAIRSP